MTIEIIAELAQGFEGQPEQTRLLLKAAAASGADVAKFQLVFADELATPDYQHYELFKSLQMPDDFWRELSSYATELGIKLSLDIFGEHSLRLAQKIGVDSVKLHGTDIANVGLLNAVAASSVNKVLLGAGGAHASEIRLALETLANKQVVVLLGFQAYPTPTETNQISRVKLFVDSLGSNHENLKIGFADHAAPTNPLRYALAATALGAGAEVIEKHLTLGRAMELEDFESALNPDEFLEFSQTLKDCAAAYGATEDSNDYAMAEAEQAYRKMIRRHVVAARDLALGNELVPVDLILKRTSLEQAMTDLNSAYGSKLQRDVKANSPITKEDLE